MTTKSRFLKRSFDIFFSMIGLLVCWPIVCVSALIATFDTKANGIFTQHRVGMHGSIFTVYKIRTMRASSATGSTVTVGGDTRITSVGRILRAAKIDELPQLWNVLIGDMSFVGPRPDVPGYADRLQGEQRTILELRPGITGPATIKYADEESILKAVGDAEAYNDEVLYPDKVDLNLHYVHNWSLWGDIRYILITLRLVAKPIELRLKPPAER